MCKKQTFNLKNFETYVKCILFAYTSTINAVFGICETQGKNNIARSGVKTIEKPNINLY